MPKDLDMQQLGKFMDQTFTGRLNAAKIERIRERWKGKIVLKGVANLADAAEAIRLGLDGIIVSNHGGRQLDAGEASIHPLQRIAKKYGDQIVVMQDSGLRTGPDIARSIASGAKFTWMGRSFMYGTAALGDKGGNHTATMLKMQLQQVMEQLCCERVEDLPSHLIERV
jgi:L-lactate dehydrogenase (cytochrome)